jgi:hypothetical protein
MELTELERAVVDLVEHTPAPGKHCIRNAYRHLDKAWQLDGVDLEMAAFRAITAEEEAATGLFHSLQRRGYLGARKLKPRNHIHKNALIPFCTAVSGVLAATQGMGLKSGLQLDKSENPWRFKVWLDVTPFAGTPLHAYPEPPLTFTISIDGKPHDFSEQLQEVAQGRNLQAIEQYLTERANARNRILYAAPQGAPEVTSLKNFLPKQRQNVFILSVLYLMIDPYSEKQLFVQQALQAFLKMLKLLPDEIIFV